MTAWICKKFEIYKPDKILRSNTAVVCSWSMCTKSVMLWVNHAISMRRPRVWELAVFTHSGCSANPCMDFYCRLGTLKKNMGSISQSHCSTHFTVSTLHYYHQILIEWYWVMRWSIISSELWLMLVCIQIKLVRNIQGKILKSLARFFQWQN